MWSEKYNLNQCAFCKSSDLPHINRGLCQQCYDDLLLLSGEERYARSRLIRQRIYYLQNPDKFKEKNKKAHHNNKEERNQKRQQARKDNPEYYREQDKARYQRDREKRCEQSRNFRLANPEKITYWNKHWREQEKQRKYIDKLKTYRLNPLRAIATSPLTYGGHIAWKQAYNKLYHRKNHEIINRRHRAYYNENKDHILTQNKMYYLNNQEMYRNYYKTYYQINRDIILHKNKLRFKANPEKYKQKQRDYRTKHADQISIRECEHYRNVRQHILSASRLKTYKKISESLDPHEQEKRENQKIQNQINKSVDYFQPIIKEFLNQLVTTRNRCINRGSRYPMSLMTIYTYITHIRQFTDKLFNNGIKSLSQINKTLLMSIIENNKVRTAIRHFFAFCVKKRYILHNPTINIKNPRPQNQKFGNTLTEKEQSFLYNTIINPETPPEQALILMFLLVHGLKHEYIRKLKVNQIDFNNCKISIVTTNRNADFSIILDQDDMEILSRYMQQRTKLIGPLPNPEYLIINFLSVHRNRPVSFNSLSSIIKAVNPILTTSIIRNTWLKNFLLLSNKVRLTADASGRNPSQLLKKATILGLNLDQ